MKMLLALGLLVMANVSLAFHSVTEILPSGKILICKDYGQVKNGNKVEVYTKEDPKSKTNKKTIKTSEFTLPEAGQKIKLMHKDFHDVGKKSKHHTEDLGTAVVTEELEGEERVISHLSKDRHLKRVETVVKISKDDAAALKKDCIVAIPENNLKLTEKASVSW